MKTKIITTYIKDSDGKVKSENRIEVDYTIDIEKFIENWPVKDISYKSFKTFCRLNKIHYKEI